MFIADGVFQYALADGFQRGNALLLLLFLAAQYGKLAAKVVVLLVAVELVTEPNCLKLSTAGKYNADARVRVDVEFVVGARRQLVPIVKVFRHF